MGGSDNPDVYGAQQRWRGKFWAWDLVEFREVQGVMIKRYYPDEDGSFPMVPQRTVHFSAEVLDYCQRAARNNGLNFNICDGMLQEEFREFSRAVSRIELDREFPESDQTPESRAFGEAMDSAMAQGSEALLEFLKSHAANPESTLAADPEPAVVIELSARRRKP